MSKPSTEAPFWAFTRICLNNWHYISRKVLHLNRDINFFTGHSGSGKSTVIDALQIVLYANTDGRGFFNKAAADDSDRSLLEYLRGMVNIGENNQFSYLRNKNFSTTIALEMKRTDSGEYQTIGVIFDVDTASNEINRRFFWHRGELWENEYRVQNRAMTIKEVEKELSARYDKESCFSTSHNERFRRVLYDTYLGGLDSEKFPLLFKRAIPFRMNIRLEDFVKEYICMEQDIHIEDMQESVLQYGRMEKKIEDTCRELQSLEQIRQAFAGVRFLEEKREKYRWFTDKLGLMDLNVRIRNLEDKLKQSQKDQELLYGKKAETEEAVRLLSEESDRLLRQIASTGYDETVGKLDSVSQLCERLGHSEAGLEKTVRALKQWEQEEMVSNQTLWDLEEFEEGTISPEILKRLQESLAELKREAERQRQEAVSASNELKRQLQQQKEELDQLKAGRKAYPKYLEEARTRIQRELLERTGKSTEVHVLADLLDVREERWRNAVEGYLGGIRLNLVVPPAFAGAAMEIYRTMDPKKYGSVSVLDTEQAAKSGAVPKKGALSEEVVTDVSYLKPYMDYVLGRVVKCETIEELRGESIGITPDCLLYQSYRLQHIPPETYTRLACIGRDSLRKRIRLLESEIEETDRQRAPKEEAAKDWARILKLEYLEQEPEEYLRWFQDRELYQEKRREKQELEASLNRLKEQNVSRLEEERRAIQKQSEEKKLERDRIQEQILGKKNELDRIRKAILELEEHAAQESSRLEEIEEYRQELDAALADRDHLRYDREKESYELKCQRLTEQIDQARDALMRERSEYIRRYPGRNVPVASEDNDAYDRLFEALSCQDLETYRERARTQAKSAIEHFKEDFMYKIRSAIREAMLRRDELNQIISRLDFGKDKYRFVITKNRGPDGRFYDMFMDEALEVDPSCLTGEFENQMNLFSMEHENHYGDRIRELMNLFIPPENATAAQQEEARRNMERYADYRTYLSFDMEQIIQNEDGVIQIGLSRMIRKNSGGEGQNPLYVALLASFAQAYRIQQPSGIQPRPSIRLVVLDEAFSKMDAEKVASCIELIRGLGFQAIISATNDKIQNYIENVDKTFVFANPNKKSISIQEFERERLGELMEDL